MAWEENMDEENMDNEGRVVEPSQEVVASKKNEKRDGSDAEMRTVDFRVALALSEYGFGAMYTAKHLLRSRGMVQSWKKMGNKHHLARQRCDDGEVMRRLSKI